MDILVSSCSLCVIFQKSREGESREGKPALVWKIPSGTTHLINS